jgi:hypothetical protein
LEPPSFTSFHSLALLLSPSVLFRLSSGDLTTVLDIRCACKSCAYPCCAPQHYLGNDHLSCLGLNTVLHWVVHLLLLNSTIFCHFLRVYVSLDPDCMSCRVPWPALLHVLYSLGNHNNKTLAGWAKSRLSRLRLSARISSTVLKSIMSRALYVLHIPRLDNTVTVLSPVFIRQQHAAPASRLVFDSLCTNHCQFIIQTS